jgi:peroxiredoxin
MIKKTVILFAFFINYAVVSQQHFKINDDAPEFKLWLTDGTNLTNDSIKGKVTVLKFWFTTCMPCLTDIHKLNDLVKEFKDVNDILFIAPALDRKPAIEKLIAVHPFNFQIAYSAMDVSQKYNKQHVYPSYFIINREGKISYIDSRSKKSDINDLRKAIVEALK